MKLLRQLSMIGLALLPATPAFADSVPKLQANFVAYVVAVVFTVLAVLVSTMSSKRGHRD